jgi:hypothetical protein
VLDSPDLPIAEEARRGDADPATILKPGKVGQGGELSQMISAPSDRRTNRRGTSMALYELRTYTLRVGAMAEAVKLYQELGFPAGRTKS